MGAAHIIAGCRFADPSSLRDFDIAFPRLPGTDVPGYRTPPLRG